MVQTQTNQNGATATRKTSKKRASKVDTVPCGVCKVRKCDDEYSRSWTQCQYCLQWYHNECQGLEENEPVGNFACVECDDIE